MSSIFTCFNVLKLNKLVENKNKIRNKNFLQLILFWFFTNHI
ncbi:hypothetical protein EU99_1736 [Prochlorococcus marinus str. MIT 9321]|uniref:Uncharacterized protein n=1 Tax=Prochlorococcus marinus str. MIT 9401 TaxID=167551 RepID=A0A0A2B687_PROMR|nr:hypothetical protein EU99_1736 [Prochlorococcus marinus str. MIT 9321]KGG05407.1 hypothetical protein EV00_1041 [Prochlorococcus marinus str. MIT 9322]KGG09381.1 hypothetical protein EV01_0703 [Prochlorococcus marinus str. MIT 9401]